MNIMEKNIYTVPTLKVLQFGYERSFCLSLKDIPEDEDADEAANDGFFDDDNDRKKQKSVWY